VLGGVVGAGRRAPPGDHIVFMSNGGFEGASRRLLQLLQRPHA
jgi:UDP-N-acetylmuramate-alanine ligase